MNDREATSAATAPPYRVIFRADALRRHSLGRDQQVLPRYLRPRMFLFLWIILGLVVLGGTLLWLARIPTFVDGPAIVAEWPGHGQTVALAFLSPTVVQDVRVGQLMIINDTTSAEFVPQRIMALEAHIGSPTSVRARFGLDTAAALAIPASSTLAIAQLVPANKQAPIQYAGSLVQARIAVGSRQAVTFVPLIGQLFGG